MQYLKRLILSFPYFERVPDQSIIVENGRQYDRLIATRGNDYLLVYNYTSREMKVDLTKISGSRKRVWWMNAGTGILRYLGEYDSKVLTFRPHKTGFGIEDVDGMNADGQEFTDDNQNTELQLILLEILKAGIASKDKNMPIIEERKREIKTDDWCSLIYTSGTTGAPKGVMLSHRNLCSNFVAHSKVNILGSDARILSFLPLNHVYERSMNYHYQYKGISSLRLLAHVGALLQKHGYRVGNIDSTVAAQRPKLAPHIEQMRRNIADTLGIDIDQVSVKATTTEHLGFEGREEGISAQAVALIEQI